jgi:hypothetical protein
LLRILQATKEAAMKAAILMFAVFLLCAGCGEETNLAEQNATERSAGQPNDPYPEQEAANGPETPDETARDVLAAREQGREAERQTNAAAEVVEADSRRQVEVERCHALPQQEQEQCIARANAAFERVKERVRQRLDEQAGSTPESSPPEQR